MKILLVSPEAGSWEFPSSLVDAVDCLAQAYVQEGHEVRVYSPFFPNRVRITGKCSRWAGKDPLSKQSAEVLQEETQIYRYIVFPGYFDRPDLYNDENQVAFSDNHLRFALLSSVSLCHCLEEGFIPELIHCQEWGGGLAAAHAKLLYAEKLQGARSVLTLHNARYDFHCLESEIERLGLDRVHFGLDGFEFWGKVSLLKAGIYYSDAVCFTSPGYHSTVLQGELPGGIRGFLEFNSAKIHGVQNGLDYSKWVAPEYDRNNARKRLRAALGLFQDKDPLMVYCHVDAESGKVSETLSTIMSNILAMDIQLIVGLSRDGWEADFFPMVAKQNPEKVAVLDAHQQPEGVLSACLSAVDVLLVSGLEEPSATLLLKAMARGVLPVSDPIGGSFGLLRGYDGFNAGAANSFLSAEPWPDQILRTLRLALEVRTEVPSVWDKMRQNASTLRMEWPNTAQHYVRIALGLATASS